MREKKRTHKRVTLQKSGPTLKAPGSKDRKSSLPGILLAVLFACVVVLIVQARYTGFFTREYAPHPVKLIGVALAVFAAFVLAGSYIKKFQPGIRKSRGSLFAFFALVIFILLVAEVIRAVGGLRDGDYVYLVPISFFSIVVSLVYGQRFAVLVTVVVGLFMGFNHAPPGVFAFDFPVFMVLTVGALAAIFGVSHIHNRTRLLGVGLLTGLAHALMILTSAMIFENYEFLFSGEKSFVEFLHSEEVAALSSRLLMGLANGVIVGFLVSGLLPFIEKLFDITTDISLIELSDQNQPILKRFFLEAPGSYHHSLIVGNLAEAASEAIGANPLLARVGSYFHDIGKITKPEYFNENESGGASMHAKLTPAMSTLIIVAHVKDGVEIGTDLDLPPQVIDIIRTHHGNGVVEFFYHEARKEAEKSDEPQEVLRSSFRYPGPKPRFREAGVVMLADSIEAVSRTLEDPTPSRIEHLVGQIVEKKLSDGQLDDSHLTLTDLKKIRETFTRVLTGIFHSRIKYPDQE